MERNKSFLEAYGDAASELESLLQEQDRIEVRILALRKTMNALAILITLSEGKDKKIIDDVTAWLRDTFDSSITENIARVINASGQPLTASEIRDELKELGDSLAQHSNPLATIHAILGRLSGSGRVNETLKDGKKAWVRVERSANCFADIMKPFGEIGVGPSHPARKLANSARFAHASRQRTMPPPPESEKK